MSAPQTAVATTMAIGSPGQLADLHTQESGSTESRISTEAVLSLPTGTLVVRDGAAGCKLITNAGDTPAGIVIDDKVYDYPSERDTFGPLPGLPVSLLRGGDNERILVRLEETVVADGAVRVRIATENRVANPPVVLGGFRTTSGGAGKTVVLAGVRYSAGGSAGDVGELEITGQITIASAD